MTIKRTSIILSTVVVISWLIILSANKWLSSVIPWYVNLFVDNVSVSSLDITKVNHQRIVVNNVKLTYDSHHLSTDIIIDDLTINYDIESLISLQRINQLQIGTTKVDVTQSSVNQDNSINKKSSSENSFSISSILSVMENLDDYALPFNTLSLDTIEVNYQHLIHPETLSFKGHLQVKSHSDNHSIATLSTKMTTTQENHGFKIDITNNINQLKVVFNVNNNDGIHISFDKANMNKNNIIINNYINLSNLFNKKSKLFYQSMLAYLDDSHPLIQLLDGYKLAGKIEQDIIITKKGSKNLFTTHIQTLTQDLIYYRLDKTNENDSQNLSLLPSFSLDELTFSSTIKTEIEPLKKYIKINEFNNLKIKANNLYLNKSQPNESHVKQLNIDVKAILRQNVTPSSQWKIDELNFQLFNLSDKRSNLTISTLKTGINDITFAIDKPYFSLNRVQLNADNLSIDTIKVNEAVMSLNQLDYVLVTDDNDIDESKQVFMDDINLHVGNIDHGNKQISPFQINSQSPIKLNHCISHDYSYWQTVANKWLISDLLISQTDVKNIQTIEVSPIRLNIASQTQNEDKYCSSESLHPLQINANTNDITLTHSARKKASEHSENFKISFIDNHMILSLTMLDHIIIDGDITSMIAGINAPVKAHFQHRKDKTDTSSLTIKSEFNQSIEDQKSLLQKLNISSLPLLKKNHITEGQIHLGMNFLWRPQFNQPSMLNASLDYQLNNVSAYLGDIALDNINSQGTIEWLPKIRTRKNLALSIDKIQPGITLSNFSTEIDFTPTNKTIFPVLTLKNPSFSVFNGKVSSQNISTDLNDLSTKFMVNLESLDLNTLVQQNNIPNISVSGKIEGVLPVSIKESNVSINRGYISTIDSGQLSYQPENEENIKDSIVGVDAVLLALKEFNYSSLHSDVSYQPDGQLELALKAKGVSPLLDTNRPVVLNINIIQNIKKLLQSLRLVNNVNNPFSDTVEQYYQSPINR